MRLFVFSLLCKLNIVGGMFICIMKVIFLTTACVARVCGE